VSSHNVDVHVPVLETSIDILDEETIRPVGTLLPRPAHMIRNNILSRINLSKTRLVSTQYTAGLIRKHLITRLIPGIEVVLIKPVNQSPKGVMNDIIVVKKVHHTCIDHLQTHITLAISRTGSLGTDVAKLYNLGMLKDARLNTPRLCRVVYDDPLMNLVEVNRLKNPP